MVETQDKMLFCFCHWGRKNTVLPDGSAPYVGGITDQIIVKTGIKYKDFVNAVFDPLCIDPSDKILHFTVKFDRSELIQLRDQEGIDTLLQFNDGFAHVYASSLEEEAYSRPPSGGAQKVELVIDSDPESATIPDSNSELYYYPDPEFSDFEKHRTQNCIAVDQIWAAYDMVDGMPRYYAHIRKVSSLEFKVRLRWLEAHPKDQRERKWVRADLPVSCGKFKRGCSDYTSDRLIFSHQVQCEKDERGLYIVYPRKGETWALFKDWDIHWSSDSKSHRKYKYEVVEILSDFVGDVGIQVVYLGKVTGFVSLFQRTRLPVVGAFFVKPKELYKFSHRVPSFKMTGTEREGVPAGSFELDPYALPFNPDVISCPGKVKEGRRNAKTAPEEDVLYADPLGTRDKSWNAKTSLKTEDLNGILSNDGESAKVQRSPTGVNISEKKRMPMSYCAANNSPSLDFFDKVVKRSRYSSPSIPIYLSCQADRELYSHTKSFVLSNSFGSTKSSVTLSDDKGFDVVVCDFKMNRSVGEFQVDQVWALYGQNSTLPKTYAQIKKIIRAPFKLHVALLEACAGPKSAAQSACGTFKVQNEIHQVYAPSSFSHVVKAISFNGNRFEIYPRIGEIWALYKNWKESCLDPDKFGYEIVEVIADSKDRIEVSSMVRVNGFKSVFKSPRIQRSNPAIQEIRRDEFGKFSHQIPSFQLTGEKKGKG